MSILLTRGEGGVSAIVEDDGRGFAPGQVREDALGLLGMRERLELLGGTLAVESTPGKGTALVAHVPEPATPRP